MQSTVAKTREDLGLADLKWFVSQQPPLDHKSVNQIDVTSELAKAAKEDSHLIHIPVFDLPKQEKRIVLNTEAIMVLGKRIAEAYLEAGGN